MHNKRYPSVHNNMSAMPIDILTWILAGLELHFGVSQVVLNDDAAASGLLDSWIRHSDSDKAKQNEQLHLGICNGGWLN